MASEAIVEAPVSAADSALLTEMRALLAERIGQYWEHQEDDAWLSAHGLQERVLSWRHGNDRFQQLPDDENMFGSAKGLWKPSAPWSVEESALEAEWPDRLLLKFLQARDRNVSDATNMFLRMCLWRDAYGASEMSLMPCQPYRRAFRTFLECTVSHTDKHGRLVYYGKNGAVQANVFRTLGTLAEYTLNHVWFVEWLLAQSDLASARLGKRVDRAVFVIDLKGVTLEHAGLRDIFKAITALDNAYYPELVGAHYVLNAPAFFTSLWSVAKQLLAPATVAKVRVLGSDYTQIMCDELGAENVPAEYGGLCQCRGEGVSCFQPKQPIPPYVSHSPEYVLNEATAKKVEGEMKEWCKQTGVQYEQLATLA